METVKSFEKQRKLPTPEDIISTKEPLDHHTAAVSASLEKNLSQNDGNVADVVLSPPGQSTVQTDFLNAPKKPLTKSQGKSNKPENWYAVLS